MTQSFFVLSTLAVLTTASVISQRAQTSICGQAGYDKATEGYFYGNQATYAGCSAQCQKSKDCKSFSFGDGICNLYNVVVTGNFGASANSPFMFYDASCISTASTTPGKTSSSSTKNPSSTKTPTSTSKSSTTKSSTTKSSTTTTRPSTTSPKSTTTSTKTQVTTTKTKSVSTTTKAGTTSSKPTTTSTKTKVTTTTTASTKSTSASSSGPPTTPPCPLPTFVVTNFKYFNSTHNCDCAGSGPDIGDGTGCLDSNGAWCDPKADPNCTHCGINVCSTGLGAQPIGYGPPDSVKADISNIGSCWQENPGTTPRRPVSGNNVVRCGGSQLQWIFDGDSTKASSVANFYVQNQIYCPNGGYYMASGRAQTAMSCTYDSGRNATCLLNDSSFGIVATSFSNAVYPSS